MKTLPVAFLAVALLFGCDKAKETIDGAIGGGGEEKTFTINGTVSEVNPSANTITMLHDDAGGKTNGTYELRGEQVSSMDFSGRRAMVTATLHKRGRDYWLTDVKPRQ